jgi:hypothetical protein
LKHQVVSSERVLPHGTGANQEWGFKGYMVPPTGILLRLKAFAGLTKDPKLYSE